MRFVRRPFVAACLLFCIALLPRVFSLGRALTTDEAYHWQDRSAQFLAAVSAGRFADTMLTGHPGVTTMWLGSVGLIIERALARRGLLPSADDPWSVTTLTAGALHDAGIPALPPFEVHLALIRLPLAIITALAIPIGYLLLRRVVAGEVALVAALLWAGHPFLVAHSRVLHLDALLTMLMLLATLALLAACFDPDGPRARPAVPLLAAGGVATGLAHLTKAPALLLLPTGGLILLAWYWPRRGVRPLVFDTRLALLCVAAGVWIGSALLTAFIVWPALWVAPQQAVRSVVDEVITNGGAPHNWGNFLLGRAANDPGLLFYPVVLFARTPPWTVLGLGALAAAAGTARARLRPRQIPRLLIAAAALMVLLAMTAAPKKADRYVLPAVPLIDVLAACGLAWLFDLLRRPAAQRTRWRTIALWALFCIPITTTLAWYHPYYLAYYSPLIGGGAQAPRVVPVGWGEGMDAVADWLNARPDIATGAVATWSPPTLQAYLRTAAILQTRSKGAQVRYFVVYVLQSQTGKEGRYFSKFYPHCPPLHTVRIHGIEYAWIYRVQQPATHSFQARFGEALILDSATLAPSETCGCAPPRLQLTLKPLTAPEQQTYVFVHVTNAAGQRIAQLDVPLEAFVPAADWKVGSSVPYQLQVPLPAGAPAGEYNVFLGLYQPRTGQRLPLQAGRLPHDQGDGPDALLVETFTAGGPVTRCS